MKYFDQLAHSLESFIEDEFRGSVDIKEAIKDTLRAIKKLDESIVEEIDKSQERIEARRILRAEIDELSILSELNDGEKDLVANLCMKYNKEVPSEEEFRENIYKRVMNLSNDSVIIMANGRSNIISLGKSLGSKSDEEALERGLEALRKDSYLPRNIESTYAKAINNIYDNKNLFMAFLIDYFRNV